MCSPIHVIFFYYTLGFCANNTGDARMGDSSATVPEREGGLVSPRRLVHGFRYRPHIYIPFLAFTGK